jgi:hypothetical protein
MSRFCKDELDPKFQHDIKAYQFKSHLTIHARAWREGGVL